MGHNDTIPAMALALGAAASFAVSNVTQMAAVRRHPARPEHPTRVDAGVLVRVGRDPRWLVGLLASIAGFGLEAAALSMAPVVLVQPLIVSELAFAIPLAAVVGGRRMGWSEWTGIGLVSAGLVAVMAVIRPSDEPIRGSATEWVLLFVTASVAVAALTALAPWGRPIARTSLYAAAAGGTFGLLSVVTKATTEEFQAHGPAAFGSWPPWALAAVGLVGMTLAQNAYRAGPLAVSLPLLDMGEPVVGSGVAIGVFGERLGHIGPGGWAALAAGAVAVVFGIVALDRSWLVRAGRSGDEDPSPARQERTGIATPR